MNIFLRGSSILRTFARIVAFSLLAALFTIPSVVSSQAVTYETGQDEMYLLPPGTSSERTGNWYNVQLDNGGQAFVGGANLALTPNSTSASGVPTYYPYAETNTLVVKRISSPYRTTWECVPWGSLFNNTTELNASTAVSKAPFLYDPKLAGKMVEFLVWNQGLNGLGFITEYSEGMTCDGTVDPTDNDGNNFGPHSLTKTAFIGNIYYAGLTSDTSTVQWSPNALPLLNTVASGGATFSWADTTSESLTVVTMAHQTDASYGSDSFGWTPAQMYYPQPGATADTPTVIACFAAKDLHQKTFGVTGNNFVFNGSNYEYMASNRPQVQISVMDNAYLGAGTSCETQYVNAFEELRLSGGGNVHPPTESFPMQLPVAIPNVLTVNPGESFTATTIDPALNGPVMGTGLMDVWVKPTGAPDTDWTYFGEPGMFSNSDLHAGPVNWSDYMNCSYPAGAEVKFNLSVDGYYQGNPESNWNSIVSTTFTVTFGPQDPLICANATPVAPGFADVTYESLTVSNTANDYLVILPTGTETLSFTPAVNNGTLTPAWYNDVQTIESLTVDGVPYVDAMPIPVDLSVEPFETVVSYYVVSPDGLHSTLVTYTFAHNNAISTPTIGSVTPASGTTAGGTSITITGTGFVSPETVTVGGVACAVTASTSTSITCTTGAHAAGLVNVVVTNPDSGAATATNAYTYVTPSSTPTIGSVTPTSGTTFGGTSVTITGNGFISTPSVAIGGVTCAVTASSLTSITCITGPRAARLVNVVVTNPDSGAATATNAYTYVTPAPISTPTIGSVIPISGTTAGGTSITITGTGFVSGQTVAVGGVACVVTASTSTSITCTTGARAAGLVNVVVTNPDTGAATATNAYTYVTPISTPTVTAISPVSGTTVGGTPVTITGTGFTPTVNSVTIGGVAATSVVRVSATSITAITGAHAAGLVNVVVTNSDTGVGTGTGLYTYVTPISTPTVTAISPVSGTTVGGTPVTITGTGFTPTVNSVTIGGVAATSVVRVSATSITAITGAHAAGLVNVVVTNSDTGLGTGTSLYTYVTPISTPTIGSVTPTSGPTAGGTSITITGTGFVSPETVTVGGIDCVVTASTSTSITCTTGAHAAGMVDVVVTNPDTGAVTASNAFTYADAAPAPVAYNFNKDILTAGMAIPAGVTLNPAANPAQGRGAIGANDVVIHLPFGTNVTSLPLNFSVATGNTLVVGSTPQVSGVTLNNFTSPVTYTVIAPDGTSKSYTVTVIIDAAVVVVVPLSIGSITPKAGPVTGGTTVNISGTGFTSGTSVSVGGAACSPTTFVSATNISCITAAHVAGLVDVVVADSGKSATAAGAYTYVDGTIQLGPLPANSGLKPGTSLVTVDGVPYEINVAPNGDANAIQLTATDWNLKLQAKGENGQPLALDDQNRIIVDPGLAAAFTGTGFMPNSDVYVYAFSESKFMGIIRTDMNGNFSSSLPVPNLAVGGHTIQLNGLSPKGEVRSASVGVVVQPKTLVASGKVYFAYASSKLDAKAKSAIAAIAKKAKAAKGNIMVKIVGWAQPTANSRSHVALSNARAASVAAALKAAGVKGKYSISGKGLAKSNVPASRYAVITVNVDRK